MPGPISDTYQGPNDFEPWVECWQCGGCGLTAGCFEDCCSGAACDPDDPETCCSPRRCDVCRGKGGWDPDKCSACDGKGEVADYVGLEMKCVGVECSTCKGTGRASPKPQDGA